MALGPIGDLVGDAVAALPSADEIIEYVEGVTNSLNGVVTSASIVPISELFDEIIITNSFPKDFFISDLAGNTDIGFGSDQAAGGLNNNGSSIRFNPKITPDLEITKSNKKIGFDSLDFMINKSLTMDWKTKNADPGNPNIIEAYKISGRGFTKDGRTGQFSWAACYVNWILNKSGLPSLETMSPRAYLKYGDAIKFHSGAEIRLNDIIILDSLFGSSHIGFVRAFNPDTKTIEILGGNQAGTVKIMKIPFSVGDPRLRISTVRRSWVPPNTPLPKTATTASSAKGISVGTLDLAKGTGVLGANLSKALGGLESNLANGALGGALGSVLGGGGAVSGALGGLLSGGGLKGAIGGAIAGKLFGGTIGGAIGAIIGGNGSLNSVLAGALGGRVSTDLLNAQPVKLSTGRQSSPKTNAKTITVSSRPTNTATSPITVTYLNNDNTDSGINRITGNFANDRLIQQTQAAIDRATTYRSATVNNAKTASIGKGPDQTVNYSDNTEANTGGWKPPSYLR